MMAPGGRLARWFTGPSWPADPIWPAGEAARVATDRSNLVRLQTTCLLGLLDCVVEICFSSWIHDRAMVIFWPFVFLPMLGFLIAGRVALRRRAATRFGRRLIPCFIAVALSLSVTASYIIGQTQQLPYGFAMVALALSGIFALAPGRFAAISGATYAGYVVAMCLTPHPLRRILYVVFTTTLAVAAANAMRIFLFNLWQRENRQLLIIAEQNLRLQQTNTALAAHNDELNELMALAAHDLRSPLFGLRNVLDYAAGLEDASPEIYRRVLAEGGRGIDTMLAFVEKLLEAHEVEQAVTIVLRREDLRTAATRAARQGALFARSADVVVETQCPPAPVWARAEPDALARILANLLSNAVRFSPTAATVTIACGHEAGSAIIRVSDTGPGIPPDRRASLFAKFSRGLNNPVHGARGSGLGLYISHKLATAMGGTLGHAETTTGGASFTLTLACMK